MDMDKDIKLEEARQYNKILPVSKLKCRNNGTDINQENDISTMKNEQKHYPVPNINLIKSSHHKDIFPFCCVCLQEGRVYVSAGMERPL